MKLWSSLAKMRVLRSDSLKRVEFAPSYDVTNAAGRPTQQFSGLRDGVRKWGKVRFTRVHRKSLVYTAGVGATWAESGAPSTRERKLCCGYIGEKRGKEKAPAPGLGAVIPLIAAFLSLGSLRYIRRMLWRNSRGRPLNAPAAFIQPIVAPAILLESLLIGPRRLT